MPLNQFEKPPRTPTLCFLAVWVAVPTLLRTATVLTFLPVRDIWQRAAWQELLPPLRILAISVPQDLLIAMQALLAFVLLRALLPCWMGDRLRVFWAGLATLLFVGVQG